jgi:hypothetical protein
MAMSAADDDAAVARALAEVSRIGAEAAELAQAAETGTAVMPASAGLPAEQVKDAMVAARSQVAGKARELAAAQQRAQDAIAAQRRALDARLAQMSAVLAPLQEQAARLQEGIWSINLYLGVGEGIVALADGAPAAPGTPIYVRQGVLAMDEECAVATESGGIDHLGIDEFDDWITADPAHVEQLIPEPRGVVAIIPRRAEKDYGDAMASVVNNELNHQTYLLIRNGDCLYRYIAEGFSAGTRLTPLRDEFTSLFVSRRHNPATRGFEPVRLEPGTPGWERAERAAGARERHYMRVALILQGLIDRTAVFQPLPAPNLSLLHPQAYDDGHIVLVSDDEMALTAGRQPFRDWLRERNAQLRPGMRFPSVTSAARPGATATTAATLPPCSRATVRTPGSGRATHRTPRLARSTPWTTARAATWYSRTSGRTRSGAGTCRSPASPVTSTRAFTRSGPGSARRPGSAPTTCS